MNEFDEIERSREANEHLAYERYAARSWRECACGHDEDAHDEDGVCQIRTCACTVFTALGGAA